MKKEHGLNDAALAAEILKPHPRIHPEKLAWMVLLSSFLAFCLLCAASTYGVYYFLFQSTVPIEAAMQVGRGTVALSTKTDPVGRSVRGGQPTYLSNNTVVSADSQSQGTISFRDSNRNGRLLAAMTFKADASLALRSASAPRFDWSANPYSIELYDLSGDVDVFIPENLGRGIALSIQTPHGSRVALSDSGKYTVSASENSLRVFNREGVAVVFAPDPTRNRSIPVGMQGAAWADNREIALSPAYIDLLGNSTFEDVQTDANNLGPGLPTQWGCTNDQAIPRGSYGLDMLDGRQTLRLLRADNASNHGETRCIQAFQPAQTGIDVRQHSYLALRATFLVNYQSLSACGIEGSECPLMLRMDYLDINGNPQPSWFHGFYARLDPGANYPLRCSSCTLDHERIYEKAWYTYDSGNLFAQFPPDKRPGSILFVQFYASGHQYDVFVSEVALLAGQVEPSSEG